MNLTCNGKCSCCGHCCVTYIPVTKQEVQTIKRYVKKHKITLDKCHPLMDDKNLYLTLCPFYKDHKCLIYPIRPEVCRKYICSMPKDKEEKNREYFQRRADYNITGEVIPKDLHPLQLLIYDNPLSLLLIAEKIFHANSPQKLIDFLIRTGNKDVADAIVRGDIVCEWREDNDSN